MILCLIHSLAGYLKISPFFGLIDLAIRSRIVDFPPPGPTIATEVYGLIVKFKLLR